MRSRLALALLAALVCLPACDEDDDFFIGNPGDVDRLAANLTPLIAADAFARLDYDDGSGVTFDRLEVDFELDLDDFAELGVDPPDFDDENVEIEIRSNGTLVFFDDLRFSDDRRNTTGEVVWSLDVRGSSVPFLDIGDVAEISVNGTPVARGTIVAD